jgi:hypothetical protein
MGMMWIIWLPIMCCCFFYIVLSTTLIKNKYSEKETPGHFEKKVCQWRVCEYEERKTRSLLAFGKCQKKREMLKRTNISVLAWREVNFIYLINVCDNLLVQDDRQGVSLWMSINSVEVFLKYQKWKIHFQFFIRYQI